ncbi:MAG: valine--tRNA ligase [Acidobacteria bacterium]|nr:valine--tRNA ligase [Acidobacteriota bacterium]MDA1236971.1 valine--tRNA ligase [Acidobacteriota bacterium]
MELDKIYEPGLFEPKWAKWWVDEELFVAETDSDKPTYSLVAPPPNVTGALHMGHCFEISMTDITMRWRRMSGDNVLWLPGLDHAGIATQMLVERHLKAQGIDRREIGREKFLEHVWKWKEEYGGKIVEQFKRIGASCDWSRQRFTMDPGVSRAVIETFVRLYERGLLYRGEYMINWDPGTLTALSDLEVVYEQQKGHLWHLRYPVTGSDEYIVVATTRPETMLGDTAVAVHPDDERYQHLKGKTITLPIVGRELRVIFDDFVDPAFGTGIVKITPAHDPNDFAAGQKHGLEIINILDVEAKINENGGKYEGLDRYEARKQIVAELESLGLIEKIEDYVNNVGKSQRSGLAVEPRVSTQWFVKTKALAEPSIKAVESGEMEIMPEQWRRNYFEWMHNIRDWCVSRQLWWGHRIPAWYTEDGEMFVARSEEEASQMAGGRPLKQDDDVLDTWFSSGLWPFSTMGWPDDTADLKAFYPNSLLITGFDILFFWVARMTMLGIGMMGQAPFKQVLIHGLVRDADKQKMSKTKGNVIDPIEMTEKYGTDAVRFALVASAGQGSDVVLSEERIAGYATFANKVWNAMRFVFMSLEKAGAEPWTPENLDDFEPLPSEATGEVPLADRWIFSRLDTVSAEVNQSMEKFRYHEAASQLYQFFWKEFCDWYIEVKKLDFKDDSGLTNEWKNMLAATERALRLLHPVAPFITEELWQRLAVNTPGRVKSLALASYPQAKAGRRDAAAERQVHVLQEATTGVRNLRAEMNIPPRNPLTGILYSPSADVRAVASEQSDALQRLACVTLSAMEGQAPEGQATHHTTEFDLEIELPKEQKNALKVKLAKQLESLEKAANGAKKQLGNEAFLAKAPDAVVAGIKEKLADYESQIERIKGTLEG